MKGCLVMGSDAGWTRADIIVGKAAQLTAAVELMYFQRPLRRPDIVMLYSCLLPADLLLSASYYIVCYIAEAFPPPTTSTLSGCLLFACVLR